MSTRRRIATVIALLGVFVVGSKLVNAWPRETPILYEVGPNFGELDVDVLQEGEAVSSVRFRRPAGSSEAFRHSPRLQPGTYQVYVTMREPDGSSVEEVRSLVVPTGGLTRFDFRAASPAQP